MALTNETVQLRAKAKRAQIPNFGSMSAAELRAALKYPTSGSKRKSASKVGGKRKSASAVTKRTSSTRKSTKKTPAAKSVSTGKAKRSSAGGTRERTARTVGKDSKRDNRSTRQVAQDNGKRTGKPGRNLIDRSAIDWKAEWPGGESGNRGIIMKALRRFKGNYAKVYDHLKPQARKMFPKSSKTGERYSADKARAQLRWYVGRTAFDFVTATGQHQKSTNRKPDRRTNGKAAGSRQTRKTGSGRTSPTRKPATRKKGAQGRARASQKPGGKTRKSTKRKSVKR
jgi:hypothetical protein